MYIINLIYRKFQKIVSKNIFWSPYMTYVHTNILCEKIWHSNNFEEQKVEKPMSQIPYILAAIDVYAQGTKFPIIASGLNMLNNYNQCV